MCCVLLNIVIVQLFHMESGINVEDKVMLQQHCIMGKVSQ